jgi:hypothetical protein
MKKILFILILSLACLKVSAQTPYIGGSVTLVYSDGLASDNNFHGGYEFNEKWAVGGTVGLNLVSYNNTTVAGGFVGINVRYTPWHNDVLYTDIKWRTEALLRDAIGVEAADLGFVGSLRFRVSDHFDIYTDFLPVGVRYSGGDTFPMIGILCSGCSLGLLYRFK